MVCIEWRSIIVILRLIVMVCIERRSIIVILRPIVMQKRQLHGTLEINVLDWDRRKKVAG
jgi:hypothetical protein